MLAFMREGYGVLRPLGVALVVALAALTWTASPAAAHTALVETIPDNRATLEAPPEELTIVFAEPVDPRSVRLEVLTLEGESLVGVERLTPDSPESEVIVFALPPLPDGIYGLPWQTVGPDGHRVAGEVVLGVGAVDATTLQAASFVSTPPLDRALEIGSVLGRYVFYLGLSLFAGAVWILWCRRFRCRGAELPAEPLKVLESSGMRTLRWGAAVLLVGVVARLAATVWSLARGYDGGSATSDLISALTSQTGTSGLLGLAIATVLLVFSGRLEPVLDRTYPLSEARAAQDRLAAGDQMGKITLAID